MPTVFVCVVGVEKAYNIHERHDGESRHRTVSASHTRNTFSVNR